MASLEFKCISKALWSDFVLPGAQVALKRTQALLITETLFARLGRGATSWLCLLFCTKCAEVSGKPKQYVHEQDVLRGQAGQALPSTSLRLTPSRASTGGANRAFAEHWHAGGLARRRAGMAEEERAGASAADCIPLL